MSFKIVQQLQHWHRADACRRESSLAVGVGFASMENVCLLFGSASALSAGTILARGFGAGMMHGVSTLAVGYSMTFASARRKLSYIGTIAALSMAIIYHSIYNSN